MSSTPRADDPIAGSLREHVLEPVSEAERATRAERAEVDAERQAFAQFRDRVAGLETVSMASPGSASPPQLRTADPTSRRTERLRNAFRETVMSVDHYEEVYDEPLEEHAAAELSPDVAAGFGREASTPFTEWYKQTLVTAAGTAVERRETFREQLDAELASLDSSRSDLVEVLDTIRGPSVSPRYRSVFENRLDEVAQTRQETIHQRTPAPRTDGHALCQYLYRDQEWTYPVLTAIARFRTAVA